MTTKVGLYYTREHSEQKVSNLLDFRRIPNIHEEYYQMTHRDGQVWNFNRLDAFLMMNKIRIALQEEVKNVNKG